MANFTVIKVENFKIFAFHGCNKSERKEGQYFYINLEASFQVNSTSDNLEATVDYLDLCRFIEKIFKEKKYNILEKLAHEVSDRIIKKFGFNAVNIEIKKNRNTHMPNIDYFSVKVEKNK